MAIRFYVPRDEFGFLSNFAPYGVELDGRSWPTVEHFFQAQKFVTTDPAWSLRIAEARRPKEAADLGRDRRRPLRADWEAVKDDVMRRGVRDKFERHADIRQRLLATGDEALVEASPIDAYWGVGANGAGLNRLGTILMEVRAALALRGS